MAQSPETKTCKYCSSEIPKDAKVCPYCRKKQKHTVRNIILIILGLLVLFFIVGAMSGGGSSTEDSGPSVYTIGQTASEDGIDITLNSAQVTNELTLTGGLPSAAPEGESFIVTDWTILNNSDSEIVAQAGSFDAYADNTSVGTSGYSIMIDGALPTDLTLEPGRQIAGKVVFEVPQNWSLFEISFKPNVLLDNSINFQITPDQVNQ